MPRSLDDLVEDWDEELEWVEDSADLGQVLRGALSDDYSGAGDEEMDDALEAVLDAMSPAEAFSFSSALKQIERGSRQALANPMVSQAVRTALPMGAGALGTVIGGPLGTAVGSKLGTVAASALAGPAAARPGAGPGVAAVPGVPAAPGAPAVDLPAVPVGPAIDVPAVPGVGAGGGVAGGSAAAAQGFAATQHPDVLRALLALAMGQHGQKTVNGIPVAGVMNMLSSVFGQAAADADELLYLDGDGAGESEDFPVDALADDRSLYVALMDADNYELSEGL